MKPNWHKTENLNDHLDRMILTIMEKLYPLAKKLNTRYIVATLFTLQNEVKMEKSESLWSLQDRLLELEESINSDETELEFLLGDIAQKIDNIKYVIDTFELESERFKRYKDEMAQRQKSLENAANRLKTYVINCLESHGTSFEKGKLWTARIRDNKRVETLKDPSAIDLMDFASKGIVGVIRTKYDWDKTKLKELLSSPGCPDIVTECAKMTINKTVSFSAYNAAKKEQVNEQ